MLQKEIIHVSHPSPLLPQFRTVKPFLRPHTPLTRYPLCIHQISCDALSVTLNSVTYMLVFIPHLVGKLLEEKVLDLGLTETCLELTGTPQRRTGLGQTVISVILVVEFVL